MLTATAAALAGCAPAVPHPSVPATSAAEARDGTPSPRPSRSSATQPSTTPSLSPTSAPAAAVLLTKQEVEAQFADQTPSQWGLEVDGVVLRTDAPSIALTFDACGGSTGSGCDEELIAALVDSGTPATLFVNARWIDANPQTTRDLLNNPLFELANHGTRHVPLSVSGRQAYGIGGTASAGEVYDEVAENQVLMTELTGAPPRFFRPGTAHFDDVAARIVAAMGLVPVNFDINADAGATFTAAQVRRATAAATAGSICIGHFNRPGSGTAAGIAAAIVELSARGATFARLGDVLE